MIRPDEYWAGQTDGDGSIGVFKRNGAFRPRFGFKTTHEETVRAFQRDMGVGGVSYCYPPSAQRPNWRPRWAFSAAITDTFNIVRRLAPYLIEKRHLAELLLGVDAPPLLARGHAYFAGLTDAEGYIGLAMSCGSPRPKVCLKMVDAPTVRAMYEAMGVGTLAEGCLSRSAQQTGRKPQSQYQAITRDALAVVTRLRPFLLTKAGAADEILRYYENGQHTRDKKLNSAKRNEIRRRYSAGERQSDLAVEFGVNHVTVSEICRFVVGLAD